MVLPRSLVGHALSWRRSKWADQGEQEESIGEEDPSYNTIVGRTMKVLW